MPTASVQQALEKQNGLNDGVRGHVALVVCARIRVRPRVEAHDLPYICTAGVKRSFDVRAHLHRLWRHLVKQSALQLVAVTRYRVY